MAGPNKIVKTTFKAEGNLEKKFSRWDRMVARFGRNSEKSFKRASRSASRFQDVFRGNIAANAAAKGFDLMRRGMLGFITEASKVEDAVAGFTPILGGVAKANKLVEMLNQTAATTPFQFENIADVAKQLLPVMNGNLENTIDTFRMLGDTAGGNIQKLDSITRGYTKALLKGKPDMEALNMIAEAGVPIFSEMAESMGITKQELFDMSKRGKLTTKDLTKTFRKMTSEGGLFFKGMEIASKTFTGKMSTMTDNVKIAAGAVGAAFLPALKDLADSLIIVAGRARAWAIANQDLIKSKISDFIQGVKKTYIELKPTLISVFQASIRLAKAWREMDFSTFNIALKGTVLILKIALKTIDLLLVGIEKLGEKLGEGAARLTLDVLGESDPTEALKRERAAFIAASGPALPTTINEETTTANRGPNQQEAAAKAFPGFQGKLTIAGAPEGSTMETKSAPPGFSTAMLGQN